MMEPAKGYPPPHNALLRLVNMPAVKWPVTVVGPSNNVI